jgi:hypothetical protein
MRKPFEVVVMCRVFALLPVECFVFITPPSVSCG